LGWNRYPNCRDRLDPRCRTRAADGAGARAAGWFSDLAPRDAHFARWALGILLTAILLGLGSPFWVEVVNSMLRARQLIRGSGVEGAPPPTAPPLPTAPQPTSPAQPVAIPIRRRRLVA
jgi:hypothetical protein